MDRDEVDLETMLATGRPVCVEALASKIFYCKGTPTSCDLEVKTSQLKTIICCTLGISVTIPKRSVMVINTGIRIKLPNAPTGVKFKGSQTMQGRNIFFKSRVLKYVNQDNIVVKVTNRGDADVILQAGERIGELITVEQGWTELELIPGVALPERVSHALD